MKLPIKLTLLLTCLGVLMQAQNCITINPTPSPNIGLYVIATNACNWGNYTNSNMGFLDSFLSGGLGVPRLWFPPTTAPANPTSGLKLWVDSSDGLFHTLNSAGVNAVLGSGGGGMIYPAAGIAVSTGSAWAASLTAPGGALVGTTATQALTNKDLTGAGNNFPTFNQNTSGSAGSLSANLPVSRLNSGTGASSATFWRGDGTWATPSGSGGNVNAAGTLTTNQIVLGAGTQNVSILGSLGTITTLLHGNASGVPTFSPVSLTADISGNLPVTNLNSGTGASSSTFWRGDGTWGTPAGGGGTNNWTSGSGVPSASGTPGTGTYMYFDTALTNPGPAQYFLSAVNTWSPWLSIAGGSNCLSWIGANGVPVLDINTACVPQLTAANTFTGALTAPSLTATGLTSGECVQTGVGGILQTTGAVCGTGGGGGGNTTSTSLTTGNLPVGSGTNAISDSGIVATTVSTASNTQTVTNKNFTSGTNTFPTFNQSTTGNAATATALAANPTDCSAATFAIAIAVNGNLTCAAVVASNITSGTFGAAQMPAFTGDITSTSGSVATTLANTAVSAGSYNNPTITVDGKGRLTGASQVSTFIGTGTATFAVQAAAGSGATVSCQSGHVCDSYSGTVALTIGTSPTIGNLLIVSLAGISRTNTPNCSVDTESTATATYQAFRHTFSNNSSFNVVSLGSAPTASEAYTVTYVCGGS